MIFKLTFTREPEYEGDTKRKNANDRRQKQEGVEQVLLCLSFVNLKVDGFLKASGTRGGGE